MASTFAVNDQRDLYLADGKNLVLTNDQDATGRIVMHRCLMRLGENIFNTSEGVDYFGTIFNADPDLLSFQTSLMDTILATPDVLSVGKFSLSNDKDHVKYIVDITTSYGVSQLNNTVSS